MDSSTHTVFEFLKSMAPVREELGRLVHDVNRRSEVKLVSTYNPQMLPSTDFGVSAVLHSGAVVDFWIELRFESDFWTVECSLFRHDPEEEGAHVELAFPDTIIKSVADMPKILLTALGQLREASSNPRFYVDPSKPGDPVGTDNSGASPLRV